MRPFQFLGLGNTETKPSLNPQKILTIAKEAHKSGNHVRAANLLSISNEMIEKMVRKEKNPGEKNELLILAAATKGLLQEANKKVEAYQVSMPDADDPADLLNSAHELYWDGRKKMALSLVTLSERLAHAMELVETDIQKRAKLASVAAESGLLRRSILSKGTPKDDPFLTRIRKTVSVVELLAKPAQKYRDVVREVIARSVKAGSMTPRTFSKLLRLPTDEDEVALNFDTLAIRSNVFRQRAEERLKTLTRQEELDAVLKDAVLAIEAASGANAISSIYGKWFPKKLKSQKVFLTPGLAVSRATRAQVADSLLARTKELGLRITRKKYDFLLDEAKEASIPLPAILKKSIASGKLDPSMLPILSEQLEKVVIPASMVSNSEAATDKQKERALRIADPFKDLRSSILSAQYSEFLPSEFPAVVDDFKKAEEVIEKAKAMGHKVAIGTLDSTFIRLAEDALKNAEEFLSRMEFSKDKKRRMQAAGAMRSLVAAKGILGIRHQTPPAAVLKTAKEFAQKSLAAVKRVGPERISLPFLKRIWQGIGQIKNLVVDVMHHGMPSQRKEVEEELVPTVMELETIVPEVFEAFTTE